MGIVKNMNIAVSEWAQANLPVEVRRNINVATYDLLFGPTGPYEPDGDGWQYLGWEAALDIIGKGLEEVPETAFYIPWCDEITFAEPEDAEDCYILNLRKEILGQLSEYV
jgi:hypothetical protein